MPENCAKNRAFTLVTQGIRALLKCGEGAVSLTAEGLKFDRIKYGEDFFHSRFPRTAGGLAPVLPARLLGNCLGAKQYYRFVPNEGKCLLHMGAGPGSRT